MAILALLDRLCNLVQLVSCAVVYSGCAGLCGSTMVFSCCVLCDGVQLLYCVVLFSCCVLCDGVQLVYCVVVFSCCVLCDGVQLV